ncbi:MAG: AbrB/MazE/SpoVT family DNA-binding domain-containing protein [Patescibacteria group bacterium]|nr:AbrB/MazE/SpoVT family DNA-binding domain-containing protein [Patescibacteria group bacterium]MDD5566920.1 AbrB/MazE/SpoVT family DNA-binding domain-containing protein [Patescibacteria group bacterium]
MNFHGITYGLTKVGSRGQIVIPAKARADLKLKEGDQLFVFGRHRFIGLVKSEDIRDFVDHLTSQMSQDKEELKKWKKSLK